MAQRDIGVDAEIDKIRLREQASVLDSPASGYGFLYVKSGGVYFKNSVGSEIGPFAASAGSIPYIKVSDVKSSGTNGGTFTSGAWQKRDINTEDNDTDNLCSIASSQITLEAGTYRCLITAPAFNVVHHQARLYNTTTALVLLLGQNSLAHQGTYPNTTHAIVSGRFVLGSASVLEIQHRCTSTGTTNGFGVASSWGNEVYTVAEFWKES